MMGCGFARRLHPFKNSLVCDRDEAVKVDFWKTKLGVLKK